MIFFVPMKFCSRQKSCKFYGRNGEDEKLFRGQLHDTRILEVLKFLEINFRLDKIRRTHGSSIFPSTRFYHWRKPNDLNFLFRKNILWPFVSRFWAFLFFFCNQKTGKIREETLAGEYTVKKNRRKAVLNANGLVSRWFKPQSCSGNTAHTDTVVYHHRRRGRHWLSFGL